MNGSRLAGGTCMRHHLGVLKKLIGPQIVGTDFLCVLHVRTYQSKGTQVAYWGTSRNCEAFYGILYFTDFNRFHTA